MKSKKQTKLILTDVRITKVSDLPAKYFSDERVIEALRQVIAEDVVLHKKRIPSGVDPLYGPEISDSAFKVFQIAKNGLITNLKLHWQSIIVTIVVMYGLVTLTYLALLFSGAIK